MTNEKKTTETAEDYGMKTLKEILQYCLDQVKTNDVCILSDVTECGYDSIDYKAHQISTFKAMLNDVDRTEEYVAKRIAEIERHNAIADEFEAALIKTVQDIFASINGEDDDKANIN